MKYNVVFLITPSTIGIHHKHESGGQMSNEDDWLVTCEVTYPRGFPT